MYDIPTLLALRLLASVARVQQQTLETMALDEPATHQARELLHQVDALLEEMIDSEQLETLAQEQKRLSRKEG
ncbi:MULTISPECIES: hypothetical protein [unclassified Pseudomonas]|uniref:hypothetical protein n=1 Tax=unclassified Pseudomonas TaxID=196821 RepID=UPI0008CFE034|nr:MULTISPECIES: hypothetical protein [unclassified Pseudomonas]TCQ85831.1 hypothetical protein EC839_10924 [Pseudomonas sp. JUb52]SEP48001.1 hypothetical protein SAMN02787149_1329 [Pseudomonas sp. Snoq117.2]